MIIAIDFDGTIVQQDRPFGSPDQFAKPLNFVPGAKEALLALKAAGHKLLLWSARASRHHREDPSPCSLVRAGVRPYPANFAKEKELYDCLYQEMLEFVDKELPGVFAAIDDGGSKPFVDAFIDDKAITLGGDYGWSWDRLAERLCHPDIHNNPVYNTTEKHNSLFVSKDEDGR